MYSLMLSIFPVLTVGLLSSYIASRSVQSEVDQSHRYMLNQMQQQINQFMKSLHIASISISINPAVEKSVQVGPEIEFYSETIEMNETIRRFRSSSAIPYQASIIYRKFGDFIYSNEYGVEKVAQMRLPAILDKMKPNANEGFAVPANTFDNQNELLLFRPIPIGSSYTEGVLVLHVNPKDILQFVGSIELAHGTRVLVADENRRIVISSKRDEMGRKLTEVVPEMQGKSESFVNGSLESNGVGYKVQLQTSPVNGWTYMAMTPLHELTAHSKRIWLTTWVVVGILVLLWGLIALVGSRRMYVPIKRLSDKLVPGGREHGLGDGLAVLGAYMERLADANRLLHHRLSEQFPYFKQGIFQKLLRGDMSERELAASAQEAGLELKGTCVFVCVAEADDMNHFRQTYRENDRALIHYAFLKMLEETFHGVPFCAGLTPKTGQIVLIVGMDDAGAEARNKLARFADEARGHIRTYFRFTVSIAISSPLAGFTQIGKGYQEAASLLGQRFVLGEDATIAADELDEGLLRLNRHMVEIQKRIVAHVMNGNLDDSRKLLAELVEELHKSTIQPETAMGLFAYMLGELDYMLQQTGCAAPDTEGFDFFRRLHGLRSLPELERWLANELFPAIKAQLDALTVSRQARTVSQVIQYVRDHLEDDLTLQKTADHFQLSVSYLSKIFKDEAGRNFSDYVLELRIEKAKDWLEHSNMPIKEMAERLGYASVQNFKRVFKLWCGLPPGEYRKIRRG